ncbi:MAG: hypothetical protein HY908_10035 [Myxococcales bacterium]|nr:hypothetical protein [Myxococcales bacterium]
MSTLHCKLGALVAVTAALGSAACGLPMADRAEEVVNQCSTSDTCGPTGVCVDGTCVSTRADLGGLSLQLDLPTTSPYGPGTSTLLELGAKGLAPVGEEPSGFVVPLDLVHPGLVAVSATMTLATPIPAGCELYAASADVSPTTHAVPMKLVLQPTDAARGLSLHAYTADAEADNVASALVPAGRYDVYASWTDHLPEADKGLLAGCDIPPVLLLDQTLGDAHVAVSLTVGEPQRISGDFQSFDLTGWTIDLVDNEGGRVIAAEQTLGAPSNGTTSFELASWVELRPLAVLRLTPPESAPAMPTIVWKLDAADVDGDNHVSFDLAPLAGQAPVLLEGTVLDEHGGEPLGAQVVVQSLAFAEPIGQNQAFQTSASTDGYGNFTLSLLPGTYLVSALPSDATLALSQQQLVLSAQSLPGHTVLVQPKSTIGGRATTSLGPASGIAVSFQPSASPPGTFIENLLAASAVGPSSATASTAADGSFSAALDPGVFDLSLRPSAGSGFPWLVRSRLTILPEQPAADLGELGVTNPVVLTGVVRAPDGTPLGNALVRAWLPIATSAQAGKETVLQIAETIAGVDGSYRLNLPASTSQ